MVADPADEPERPLEERHPYLFTSPSFWHLPEGMIDPGPQVYRPDVQEVDPPEQAGDVVPAAAVPLPSTHDYVQNEEQQESSQWTSTVESISREHYQDISLSKLEDYIDEIVELVKAGHLELNEVPRSLQASVQSRI
jgi:hypothetical protein